MSLFAELKRRNVVRVGAAYVLVCWMLLQIADFALGMIEAPSWILKVLVLLAALGLPAVLVFAWVYEMTPEGLKLEKDVDRSQSANNLTRKKLDRLIIGLLVLVLGYIAVDKFLPPEQRNSTAVEASLEQATGQPEMAEALATAGKSIAVLPFINMSSDRDNEYFADGLTETLLHKLAQVAELKVAARTSSFAFKGAQEDIREIAEKLDVAHVLEGSVQRSGNRVRITAQLIQASDGYHLWSQTYDRDLDNIFAVQDEIAAQVANALTGSLEIGGEAGQGLNGGTRNTEAYDLYLQGREAFHANNERQASRSERLMRRAIALDPDFALAWAGLAEALKRYAVLTGLSGAEYRDEYRSAAEKASELAPDNSQVLTTLGGLHFESGEYVRAQEVLERAIQLDPSNALAWSNLADVQFAQSRYQDAVDAATKAMRIDPLDYNLKGVSSYKFLLLGQIDKATTLAQAVLDNDPQSTAGLMGLGNIYWRTARYAEAYRIYHRLLESNPDALYVMSRIANSFIELGDWESARHIFQKINATNPLFDYSFWNGEINSWFCAITNDMECARSTLRQRIAQAESEDDRLQYQLQLARFEQDWEAALPMALTLIEHAREQRIKFREASASWWGALAADRLGQLELRDQLIDTVMDYFSTEDEQSFTSHYHYFWRAYMYALRGDKVNAVKNLQAAIDGGFRDLPGVLHLGFFDAILEEPEVQEVLERLRAINEEELERLQQVVEELGPVW